MAKLSSADQGRWFLLITDLLKVGFSLQHALRFTKMVMPRIRPVLLDVERQLATGEMLATGLQKYVSQDLYYQLRLAEQHGALIQTLNELGTLKMTEQRQRRKLRGLLQYPLILLGMLIIVVAGLIIFVYPELAGWQAESSTSAWWEIAFNAVLYLMTATLVLGGFWRYRWHRLSFRQKMIWRCRLPIVGHSYCLYYGYYLTTNLAMMLRHGLSLQEIIQVTNGYKRESLLYQCGEIIQALVSEGEQFEQVITGYPFIPNELVIFVNKGATRAELGDELTVFAQMQFKRLVQSIERLLIWVQPVMFTLIAGVIVALYLSILLPIYHSLQGVG